MQQHPSAAVFPGPEGRGCARRRPARSPPSATGTRKLGPDAVWLACSHGDVIKAILADALGLHLDQFQRIVVDPASVSVVTYTETRPFVVRVNDTGGDVSALIPPPKRRRRLGGVLGRRRRRGAGATA